MKKKKKEKKAFYYSPTFTEALQSISIGYLRCFKMIMIITLYFSQVRMMQKVINFLNIMGENE